MNVIFTCGGTGGHIMPAISVANIWKERYPDSTVICVMSGNFVQRGTPAIADKYTRAAAALAIGADERINQFGIICCLCCGCQSQCRKYNGKDFVHNYRFVCEDNKNFV